MKLCGKDFGDIFKDFQKGRGGLSELEMEIVGGENELNPIVLLRYYEAEPDVDTMVNLASQLVQNKEVRFSMKNEVQLSFTYKDGDIGTHFSKQPYLLDPFLKMCYGVMVKKLTAPSVYSTKSEEQ